MLKAKESMSTSNFDLSSRHSPSHSFCKTFGRCWIHLPNDCSLTSSDPPIELIDGALQTIFHVVSSSLMQYKPSSVSDFQMLQSCSHTPQFSFYLDGFWITMQPIDRGFLYFGSAGLSNSFECWSCDLPSLKSFLFFSLL